MAVTPSAGGTAFYVVNTNDSSVAQVDISTAQLVNSTRVGASVTAVAVDPGGTGVWANTYPFQSNSLVVFKNGSIQSLRPGLGGTSSAFGPNNGLAYILTTTPGFGPTATNVGVYQASNQKQTAVIPVTSSPSYFPGQVAVSGDGTRLYVSLQEISGQHPPPGFVLSFDTATYQLIGKVKVGAVGPMALSTDGATLYVCAINGHVQVIDTATMTLKPIIFLGANSGLFTGLALAPNGTKAYVVDSTNARIHTFNPQTGKGTGFFSVGIIPNQVEFTPDGTEAYVSDSVSYSVAIVDAASNTVTGSVAVGGPSGAIAFGHN